MGGQGSGGWNRKYIGTTEEAIKLAISDLKNAGLLIGPRAGKLTWATNGIVQLDLNLQRDGNTLSINDATCDHNRHMDDYSQKIELLERSTNKGGSYLLFRCPCCYKPRRHLYLSRFFFICRCCAKLTYKSKREHEDARLFRQWDKISAKLGGLEFDRANPITKPKGMHGSTFEQLVQKLSKVENAIDCKLARLR